MLSDLNQNSTIIIWLLSLFFFTKKVLQEVDDCSTIQILKNYIDLIKQKKTSFARKLLLSENRWEKYL